MIELELIERLTSLLHVSMVIYGAVAAANIADMVDAIVTARTLDRPMESAKLRHALWKLSKYWLCMSLPLLFDAVCTVLDVYRLPYALGLIALVILLIEFWSMSEHAKCRRDRTAKIPEVLRDIASYIGDDELKKLMADFARRKLSEHNESSGCAPEESELTNNEILAMEGPSYESH